jgi:hypothetical protein
MFLSERSFISIIVKTTLTDFFYWLCSRTIEV